MDLAVGAIVEGKVTGITKFGAFVALPEGKSGMVHISEVASTFVNDIKDFLQEGQQVKVKIINIDQAGRINLSIKKAQPQEPRQPRQERREGGFAPRQPRFQRSSAPRGRVQQAPKDPSTMSFEDKLKAFMSDSESRSQERFAPPQIKKKTEGNLGFAFICRCTKRRQGFSAPADRGTRTALACSP